MSFNVSANTLANVVTMLLLNPGKAGELDSAGTHRDFVRDLAAVVCDYCGGEIVDNATALPNGVVQVRANDSLPDSGGIWALVAPLLPFRVVLLEDRLAEAPIFYECMAEDFEHAKDQARDAYPECQVLCDDIGQESPWATTYLIFSPSEFVRNPFSGYWSVEQGWTSAAQATAFSGTELRNVTMPEVTIGRQDAMLSRVENAANLEFAVATA